MTQQNRVSRWRILQQVLEKLCQTDNIKAAFLASDEGLRITSVAPHLSLNEDELAGLVARLRQVAASLQRQMQWAAMDEVTVEADTGHRLVTRSVQIGHQVLILIVLVAPRRYYRRLTARALKIIRHAWASR